MESWMKSAAMQDAEETKQSKAKQSKKKKRKNSYFNNYHLKKDVYAQ
jgi:hypothetical protein